jgi:SAM-dependent methyltransferase
MTNGRADVDKRPVNVGCGRRFRPNWVNLDLAASCPEVIEWDAREPLPLADGSAPFLYTSHMLEHLGPNDARNFLAEAYRVLEPGGVVRIVVPDLAKLARWYLESLDASGRETPVLSWSRIHLLDQLVRRRNGGVMKDFVRSASPEVLRIVKDRMGSEAEDTRTTAHEVPAPPFLDRLAKSLERPHLAQRIFQRLRIAVARAAVTGTLGLRGLEAFDAGLFLTTGENHQWMYDVQSLSALVVGCGFTDPVEQTAMTSLWPAWDAANLDLDPGGQVYKPESLYLEARKPPGRLGAPHGSRSE